MIQKIKVFFKNAASFWHELFLSTNRIEYLANNIGALLKQVLILGGVFGVSFVCCRAMKPTVRGVCRIVLQSSDDAVADYDSRVVGVEARRARSGTTLRQIKAIGVLKANAEVVLKSEIPGKIQEVLFTEGAIVKKGQELIKFEDDHFKAERDRYEAAYKLAQTEYERMKKLYDQKVGALKDYDKAMAQANEAKAQLAEATYQLSKTVIIAPFGGTVGIMKIGAGNIVQQHTELAFLVDNSIMRVELKVPAKYIEQIAPGQRVEIIFDSGGDNVFNGIVTAIDSEVDVRNHSVLVVASVPNPTGVLKHGIMVNVTLTTGERSGVILIDEDATYRDGSVELVWIIDKKGRAYRRRVMTGAKDANGVEVVAGLEEGDWVVTAGHLKLSDGAKVEILNKDETKEEDGESEENQPEEDRSEESQSEEDRSEGSQPDEIQPEEDRSEGSQPDEIQSEEDV